MLWTNLDDYLDGVVERFGLISNETPTTFNLQRILRLHNKTHVNSSSSILIRRQNHNIKTYTKYFFFLQQNNIINWHLKITRRLTLWRFLSKKNIYLFVPLVYSIFISVFNNHINKELYLGKNSCLKENL